MRTSIALVVGPLLSLITTAATLAAPITVNNPSFEITPAGGLTLTQACQGLGCSFDAGVGAIPGWTNSGVSGEFIPGTQVGNHFAFDTIPDGITVAYSNGPTISQTVGSLVQAGVTYSLLADLGSRHDNTGFAAGADLLVNGIRYSAVGVTPAPGNWSTFTATYIGRAADVGDPITIELIATAAFPPQADFDNVRLSGNIASVVPEPETISLIGLGLAALLGIARRKRGS
jgi:hypothetical protein